MTAPAQNKLKSAATLFMAFGAVVAAAGLVYLFLTPKIYQASARMKMSHWIQSKDRFNPPNLEMLTREREMLRSDGLLEETITNLNLMELWQKRYHPAVAAGLEETRARLKSKLTIPPVADSSIIRINVTSEDREETARIANELARIYINYRKARHDELVTEGLDSLKKQWDEQSAKILTAQTNLDKIYLDILRHQPTNQGEYTYYDPQAYAALLEQRIELDGTYVARKDELARLQKMNEAERRQVLSSTPGNTAFAPIIDELSKAKSDLLHLRFDHPEDSQEVKTAVVLVDRLEKKLDQEIEDTMAAGETELAAIQKRLDELVSKLKHASTNINSPAASNPEYKHALAELSTLRTERDELEQKMNRHDTEQAIRPEGLTAELIDSAEIPSKPIVPDGRIALGVIGGGTFLLVIGAIMVLAGRKSRTAAAKT